MTLAIRSQAAGIEKTGGAVGTIRAAAVPGRSGKCRDDPVRPNGRNSANRVAAIRFVEAALRVNGQPLGHAKTSGTVGAVGTAVRAIPDDGGDHPIRSHRREFADLVVSVRHIDRSEERRVGKECRSRWWPY